jgi:beta-lactamase regulating signal transducer with metallopeptidase domain
MNEWYNIILAVSVVMVAEIANELTIAAFKVRNAQTRFRIRLISLISCFFVFLVLPLRIIELIIPSGKDLIANVQSSHILGTPAMLSLRLSRFAWITIALVIVSVLCLAIMLLFSRAIVTRITECHPASDPQLLTLVEEVSQEMGVTVREVMISRKKCDAFVYGYPPSLAIGSDLLDILDDDELRIIIRHELYHIKGKDTLVKPVVTALCIIFMYNPMVWFLSKRLAADRECSADWGVIISPQDVQAFLSLLLKFHDSVRANPHSLAVHWVGATSRIDSLFFHEKARKIPVFVCLLLTVSSLFMGATYLFEERYVEIGRSDDTFVTTAYPSPVVDFSDFFVDIPLVEWYHEKSSSPGGVGIPLQESELLELLKASRFQEGWVTIRLAAFPLWKRRQLFGSNDSIDFESDCRLIIDSDAEGHLYVCIKNINTESESVAPASHPIVTFTKI